MITKKKIRNWETIKNNDGKYNSVMDEINRNYSISKKIKTRFSDEELFKKVLIGIHQSFNIDKKLSEGISFTSTSKQNDQNITTKYKVDKFIENQYICLSWNNKNDKYWTEYQIKTKNDFSKLNYSESVLRENTISGIQGTIDIAFYKKFYKKNYKKWLYILCKSEEDIEKIIKKANIYDEQANNIKSSDEYKTNIDIYNKFKGKKNINQKSLKMFKASRKKIDKLDDKINKLKFKSNSIRYNMFILEDKWIEFVKKTYSNNEEK